MKSITKQEIRWIIQLLEREALEAGQQANDEDNPFRALCELRKDNVGDLAARLNDILSENRKRITVS